MLELGAHDPKGRHRVGLRTIDQMDQHRAALDMAEEARAEARTLTRALDQAWNVRQDELVIAARDDAELRLQGGERIIRDLRPRGREMREQGGLARVGQANQPDIGEQLETKPDPAFGAGPARIGAPGRPVGR